MLFLILPGWYRSPVQSLYGSRAKGHTMADRGAVVVGASMAGLLAARVLADRVEQVTIVERDDLPDQPADRKGVPQGRHAHGLLPSGERVLRSLFPGMMEDLAAWRCPADDDQQREVVAVRGLSRCCPGMTGMFFSRCFLENMLRQRVLDLPHVSLVRAGVQGLAVECRAG